MFIFITLYVLLGLAFSYSTDKQEWRKTSLLWAGVFILYTIYTCISNSYVHFPVVDYFIVPDQIFFYSSATMLSYYDFPTIWDKAFTNREYSELPLAMAYFASLARFAHFVGFPDILLFLKLNTTFIGSLIFPLLYKVCRSYNEHPPHLATHLFIFCILSPLLTYSCVLMRDIHVCFLYTTMFYLSIKIQSWYEWPLLILLAFITFYIRVESGLFSILFLVLAVYKRAIDGGTLQKMFAYGLMIVGTIFSFALILFVYNVMQETLEHYTERSLEYASSDSLGAQLNNLPFPFNILSKTIFGQILPFPIWFNFLSDHAYNYLRILESIFPIYWVGILLSLCHSFITKWKEWPKELLVAAFISFLYLLLCSAGEFNTRRLMAFYPILFSIFLWTIKTNKIPLKSFFTLSFVLLTILHLIYLSIK